MIGIKPHQTSALSLNYIWFIAFHCHFSRNEFSNFSLVEECILLFSLWALFYLNTELLCFVWDRVSCSPDWPQICCVANDNLKLLILLSLPPKWVLRGHRIVIPCWPFTLWGLYSSHLIVLCSWVFWPFQALPASNVLTPMVQALSASNVLPPMFAFLL